MKTSKMQKDLGFVIFVLIFGHIIGTITHLIHFSEVIKLGFFSSAQAYDVSPIINGYWLSLTLIDPIIVFLLIKKPRLGVFVGFVNLLINVVVNSTLVILSLQSITLLNAIDILGNIGTSLQIAIFVFILFYIPLFIKSGAIQPYIYDRLFSQIPLITFSAGLVIHSIGIYNILIEFTSAWETWVHFSMIVTNSLMIFAIYNKLRIGFLFGIALFGLFGLIQGWFALVHYLGFDSPWNLQLAITIAICCLAIVSLLRNESIYKNTLGKLQEIKR